MSSFRKFGQTKYLVLWPIFYNQKLNIFFMACPQHHHVFSVIYAVTWRFHLLSVLGDLDGFKLYTLRHSDIYAIITHIWVICGECLPVSELYWQTYWNIDFCLVLYIQRCRQYGCYKDIIARGRGWECALGGLSRWYFYQNLTPITAKQSCNRL